jgi:uncharacterized protein YdeI (YjbR/CyaY-like superfamily)
MKIGKKIFVPDRAAWRAWLRANHRTANEIWLINYKVNSGKKGFTYDEAVEEALCYGWIDSIIKARDETKFAQRYSPRRPGSQLSETNRERVRRLVKAGKMTKAGLEAISHAYRLNEKAKRLIVAPDILKELKKNEQAWSNFRRLPAAYKRIRIGWIEMARSRDSVFRQRLTYFVKMTARNKRFGMVR